MKATGALGLGTGIALGTGTAAAAETAPDHGANAFSNLGPVTILNSGGVFNWWFDRGGSDFGYQHGGPNVVQPFNGAKHTFYNPGKAIFSGGYTQYYIVVRNDGSVAASHNLQGGGAT